MRTVRLRRGRGRLVLMVAVAVLAFVTSGCIGTVDRSDFEQVVHQRGGGLVSSLPAGAIGALRQRLGAPDIRAVVVLLTSPDSSGFRLVVPDEPGQVSSYLGDNQDLASPDAVVHLRIAVPGRSGEFDDYSYSNGVLGSSTPVRVSASDDLSGETFSLADVPGLGKIEGIVDSALAHSGSEGAYVSSILVSRFGGDVRIIADVTAPRSISVAQFDRTGAFLGIRQA